jgi:PAS domain-containing protein
LVTLRQKQWLDQVGSVLESLNQGVIISDEDRRIIFANSMFLEMGINRRHRLEVTMDWSSPGMAA